jgi:V/A-type H+-transporting ATPase subunit I
MIVPMKKVSLVILDKEKSNALKTLRKIGVVHIEDIEGKGEVLAKFKSVSDTLFNASMLLSDIKVNKKKIKYENLSNEESLKKASRVLDIFDRKKELFDQISNATAELDRLAGWGEFDPKDFDYLHQKGIHISMYEIPTEKMQFISDEIQTVLVNSSKSITRFLILSENVLQERPQGLPPEAFYVVMPEYSTLEIIQQIKDAESELDKIQSEFNDSVKYLESINRYYKLVQKDIEFENIYSGMEIDSTSEENPLAWVTGYIPVDNFELLSNTAKENFWALASSDPTEEDPVPTKLKNNKLVSLIYPLTDFLGTVPGYNEYDISGWFLLFFAIFFGMIFGDGGYGILLTVVVLAIMLKNKLSGKKNPPLMPLGLILGIATMIWGTVTCTWFGLTPEQLPDWIKAISIPAISSAYPKGPGELSTDQNLQIFCFSLALIQLTVAHVKGMARNRKSLKFFGELGSMLQLWGMFYVVLSLVVSSEFFAIGKVVYGIPIGLVSIGCIAVGFILSFIFANYEGSVLASVLESCKGIITVLLGVVNIFSDIISYIRLWAVGLAGAAISNTVNTMAGPLFGHALLFVFALLLCVGGHGLNMILNLLSVIVHGVRLNTLEFSSHLGMSWSGIKYAPFAESESK